MKKLVAVLALVLILASFLLAIFTLVPWSIFWYAAAFCAVIAWFVLPRIAD